MSESEVSKHIKRTYMIWRRPGINWKEKLTEIIIEILIIVFAVSLSLYLERWRDNQHDRQIEKHFLTGLRNDLGNDIKEMSSDYETYVESAKGFKYFYSVNNYLPDSVHRYSKYLRDFTQLIPNTNRYEALKSSGKLDVIENAGLLDSIVDLYQDKIPILVEVFIKPFNEYKSREVFPYLDNNLVSDSLGYENLEQILKKPIARNYLSRWDFPEKIAARYQTIIAASQNIITRIDEELK